MWSWFCWPDDITTMSEKSWLCLVFIWFGLLCRRTAILQSQLFLFPQATRAKLVRRIRAYSFHCGITWNYWYRNQKVVEKLSSNNNVSKIYVLLFLCFWKSQVSTGFWGSFRSDSQTSSVWRIRKVSQYKFKISPVRKSADCAVRS